MRKAARLTQEDAGELFGGGPVAFSKYENDDLVPDEGMINLLRLAIADIGIVRKLRLLKAGTTTTAIRLLPDQLSVAGPTSSWSYEANSDDGDFGPSPHEVSATTFETFAVQPPANSWSN
jgi:HTH-type transcriptional regulator/antitoxin MqsA